MRGVLEPTDDSPDLIDFSSVSLVLQKLELALGDCQAQVVVTVDAAAEDYLKCSNSIEALSADVETIEADVLKFEESLNQKLAGTIEQGEQLAAYDAQDDDIPAATRRLTALHRTAAVLKSILQIRSCLVQFDTALHSCHLDIASDAIATADLELESICSMMKKRRAPPGTEMGDLGDRPYRPHNKGELAIQSEEDVYLLRHLKSQVLYRRSRLSHLVCKKVDSLFNFFSHGVEITFSASNAGGNSKPSASTAVSMSETSEETTVTLEQLWHALKGTALLEQKMIDLVTCLIESVIEPMISAAERIPAERTLTSRVLVTGGGVRQQAGAPSASATGGQAQPTTQQTPRSLSGPSSAVWSWLEVAASSPSGEATNDQSKVAQRETNKRLEPRDQPKRDFTFVLLDVLEELFEFISQHFFPGHPDLLEYLGKLIWPDLAQLLKQKLGEQETDGATLDRLRSFETKLKGLYLIPFETKTLATFCAQHEKIIFALRRRKILSEVRDLCIAMDPAVVAVGGEDAHDDTMQAALKITVALLEQNPQSQKLGLLHHIKESPLVLPKCYVSRAAHETVQLIEKLLRDTLRSVEQKSIDDGLFEPTVGTIRDVIYLFLLLRSSLHSDKLHTDPLYAAVFYCDILFLSRRMLLVSTTLDKEIPSCLQLKQHQLVFLDLVNTMRPVQEEVFNSMLTHQKGTLLNLCAKFGSLTSLSLDREYMQAEAHVGDVVQHLKSLALAWTNVLPAELTVRCLGRLMDTFLKALLSQVCHQVNLGPEQRFPTEDMNALAFLLTSTRNQLVSLLHTVPKSDVTGYPDSWAAFCLFLDLIDADVPEFLARKSEVKSQLSLQQVQTILIMNGRKTVPSTEILELLGAGTN